MKESYRKGIANHPGPEPCEGSREATLEASDRGICRLGIELRNLECGAPTASASTEGNTAGCAYGREVERNSGTTAPADARCHRGYVGVVAVGRTGVSERCAALMAAPASAAQSA